VEPGGFVHLLAKGVLVLVPMLLSLTVHEYAHAWSASKLGDNTAERLGRLTLNPLAHADPVGTFLLPMISVVAGGAGASVPFFGWAKPVPFDPARFSRRVSMRFGTVLVAAAGPLSNLLLALLCGGLLSLAAHTGLQQSVPEPLLTLATIMMITNISLCVFNLIPIYPLDGQKVLAGLLRGEAATRFEYLSYRFGWMGLMLVIVFAPDLMARPVMFINFGLQALFGLGGL
jgi:Zn-dependent protease